MLVTIIGTTKVIILSTTSMVVVAVAFGCQCLLLLFCCYYFELLLSLQFVSMTKYVVFTTCRSAFTMSQSTCAIIVFGLISCFLFLISSCLSGVND